MEYISALIFPFFILLIENFLPYPYVVEELFKFFLAKKTSSTKTAIILGLLFSFSEAVFYFMNSSYSLNPNLYSLRLLSVSAMHITTILIMQYFLNKKSLWPVGLLLAMLIHYLFNIISVFQNLDYHLSSSIPKQCHCEELQRPALPAGRRGNLKQTRLLRYARNDTSY